MNPQTSKPEVEPAARAPEPPSEKRGLECPTCGCRELRVVYTRRALGGRLVRRRECRHCGRRITTSEHPIG